MPQINRGEALSHPERLSLIHDISLNLSQLRGPDAQAPEGFGSVAVVVDERPGQYQGEHRLAYLTEAEAQQVPYVLLGTSIEDTVRKLDLAKRTIANHRESLYAKIGVHTDDKKNGFAAAPRTLIRTGLAPLPVFGSKEGNRPVFEGKYEQRWSTILGGLACGLSNEAIAPRIGCLPDVVRTDLMYYKKELGAPAEWAQDRQMYDPRGNRATVAYRAIGFGLVTVETPDMKLGDDGLHNLAEDTWRAAVAAFRYADKS